MRQRVAALLVVAGLAAYPGGAAYAEVAVPPLKARVTDLTGTLNAQQRSELETRIAAFESGRGSQIAVLLLPTTRPEEIDQYAIRVAEAWKIGRRKVDDGLILVVAKDDRRLRIEVGYGLEGAIPDSVSKRVIDERITPRFREGDFYGGVRDGVDQLIRLAEGEKLPPPAASSAAQSSTDSLGTFFVVAVLFLGLGGTLLRAVFGRFAGALATGLGLGALALAMLGIVAAAVAAAVGFVLAYGNKAGTSNGWSSGGGSSSGGSWSGGSSGGSSSSWGGGGGGSFGGGSPRRW
jgi:uncharacterized protein